jgi:hypothetical protein
VQWADDDASWEDVIAARPAAGSKTFAGSVRNGRIGGHGNSGEIIHAKQKIIE